MTRGFAWLTAAVAAVATLATTVQPAEGIAGSCYSCVTTDSSWAKSKGDCLKQVKTGCLFCTKADFPGMSVRGCVKSGQPTRWTDQSKMCGAYEQLSKTFTGKLGLLWSNNKAKFRASCPDPAKPKRTKEPKKGFVCDKKLCNAASNSVLSSALIFGAFLSAGFIR